MNSFHIEQTLLTHIKAWEHFDDVPLAKENRNFKPLMAFGAGLQFWVVSIKYAVLAIRLFLLDKT